MSKIFNSVQGRKVGRNVFNLSHERKMSLNMGQLVPILCQEVVPGDTFKLSSEVMLRFAPMLAPVMHRINVYTHYFYVPNRIIWDEFEDFITGNGDPIFPHFKINQDVVPYNLPYWDQSGTLPDYLGIPDLTNALSEVEGVKINALPFRAYQKIWNEWYRDQDLQFEVLMRTDSGEMPVDEMDVICRLRNRAWEKDYFTSARPWAQKGDAVELPITGQADLVYDNSNTSANNLRNASDGSLRPNQNLETDGNGLLRDGSAGPLLNLDVTSSHKVDLSTATASTINELRRAFQLQKWLERNARAGSRYTEVLRAHFGVKSSDSRLQRPEYLGGGRQPVSISEVLQTSATSSDGSLGDMGGHGISVGRSNRFKRFFEEHGYVIGIMSILPRTTYQQGIPRMFSKMDKFDYFWPEFQHIGEQEIKNQELFVGNDSQNEGTFGYTPRYAEYKYIPSTVHGDFKDSLSYWHLGRKFSGLPVLNDSFVTANPRQDIFNVLDQDVHKVWCQVYNNLKAVRPMAVYGEPGLIDH